VEAKYSGDASIHFWRRIANIKTEPEHELAYIAGCALQDHEQRVLQMLVKIESSDVMGDPEKTCCRPTSSEIEIMIEEACGYGVGSTERDSDGTLRTYYAGFNLTAIAKHIALKMANT